LMQVSGKSYIFDEFQRPIVRFMKNAKSGKSVPKTVFTWHNGTDMYRLHSHRNLQTSVTFIYHYASDGRVLSVQKMDGNSKLEKSKKTQISSSKEYFILSDGSGSPRVILNPSGKPIAEIIYDKNGHRQFKKLVPGVTIPPIAVGFHGKFCDPVVPHMLVDFEEQYGWYNTKTGKFEAVFARFETNKINKNNVLPAIFEDKFDAVNWKFNFQVTELPKVLDRTDLTGYLGKSGFKSVGDFNQIDSALLDFSEKTDSQSTVYQKLLKNVEDRGDGAYLLGENYKSIARDAGVFNGLARVLVGGEIDKTWIDEEVILSYDKPESYYSGDVEFLKSVTYPKSSSHLTKSGDNKTLKYCKLLDSEIRACLRLTYRN